ncbi:hypothetical protein BGZ80_005655, partial [Entomortierella chlamydospora]
RICLNPDPRLAQQDLNGQREHLDIHNKDINSGDNLNVANGDSLGNFSTTENDASNGMEIDFGIDQDKRKPKEMTVPNPAAPLRNRMRSGLDTIQQQALHNQGSVLASDLSILGFIKLDAIQSPPVLSRHWITLDCSQEHDAITKTSIKDEQTSDGAEGPASTDLKMPKPDESLAALLFPSNQPLSQKHPNNQFTQRPPQHHQQPYTQSQTSFTGQSPGITHVSHIPKMPPTSSKPPLFYRDGSVANAPQDQQSYTSPTVPQHPAKPQSGKKNEKESESWSQEGVPQQHLYSTLHKALDQESMVAIVALQYPDKNCTRLRKWRRAQDEAPLRSTKQSSIPTAATLLSKRLSHSQGSSPNMQSTSASDLSMMAGNPSFGSMTGSGMMGSTLTTTLPIGSSAPKDDLSSALTMASLSTVVEADRSWCGLLMVASHFLGSPFYSTPVHLNDNLEHSKHPEQFVLLIMPKNAAVTNAPWIPDLNYDRPQLSARVPPLRTQFMSPHLSKISNRKSNEVSSKASHAVQETDLYLPRGMEQFGSVRAILMEIKADLAALCSIDDQAVKSKNRDRNLENKIHNNFLSLNSVEAVYGYKGGFNCAAKMLNKALDKLPDGDAKHRSLSKLIQTLLRADSSGIVIDFKMNNVDHDNQGGYEASESYDHQSISVVSPISSNARKSMEVEAKVEQPEIKRGEHRPMQDTVKNAGDRISSSQGDGIDGVAHGITHGREGEEEEEEEEQGADENLEVGNVRARIASGEIRDQLAVGKQQDTPESRPVKSATDIALTQTLPIQTQMDHDSEAEDIEQDTVMEQSSVPQSRWSSAHQKPESHIATATLEHQQLQRKEAVHGQSRLMSPGLAPQKRRRELRDDGSDDASSVEGVPTRPTAMSKTEENTDKPMPLLESSTSSQAAVEQIGQGVTQLGLKKGSKKSKRIKSELPDDNVLQNAQEEPAPVLADVGQDTQGYEMIGTTLQAKVD